MFGYNQGMAREYSPKEKAEAVAVALTSRTLDDARSVLGELWSAPPPAKGSLSIWMRDPNIQPPKPGKLAHIGAQQTAGDNQTTGSERDASKDTQEGPVHLTTSQRAIIA